MDDIFHQSWDKFFRDPEVMSCYFKALSFSRNERQKGKTIYPSDLNILKAFRLTPLNEIKVVILAQDPYHQPGQATGLAFAVPEGVRPPPSLKNVIKAVGKPINSNLEHWAKQGVFLLNTSLTVEKGKPLSHSEKWNDFTDLVIKEINKQDREIVFCLWGKEAQKKNHLIDDLNHVIIHTAHPSPLAGNRFVKAKPFQQLSKYVEINW